MIEPLHFSRLYNYCDLDTLHFDSTEALEPLTTMIGQESALEAIDLGTNIRQDGYNLYAMGPSGSGKHSVVKAFLKESVLTRPTPDDWCYVDDFKDHQRPIAIRFPPGDALFFKKDIDTLIELLKTIIPSVFESNDYRNTREAIMQRYINRQAAIFQQLQKEAKHHDVSMNATSPSQVTFAPIVDGKVLSNKEFEAIDESRKEKITQEMSAFEKIVKEGLHEVTQLNKEEQKEYQALNRQVTTEAVENVIGDIREKYVRLPDVISYLDALEDDVISNVQDFVVKPDELSIPPFMREYYTPSFRRYMVNLFITHEKEEHAPVIFEDNPTHQNLIGRIEHISQVGTLVTDFTMIRPGALHKANGGYLMLETRRVLMQPFAWEELKRVLQAKEIRIESLTQQYSLISTTTLEPEPIPIDVKVILIGERLLYYLLYQYDPDFKELFKVSADFEEEMPRDEKNMQLYAQMIGTIAKKDDLLPLTREAVARVIEQSSREAGDSTKISTQLRSLSDLLKEADYWAQKASGSTIDKQDIDHALKAQKSRMDRIQRKIYEQIAEGTVMIATSGSAVGQVNALSYLSMGGFQFGMPARITAQTRLGKGEIIDIERKVELSGPIHAKGVMILSAYLGSRYAQTTPMSLSASLVFEQSYGMIEGDSASSTELYALLSSLADLPIRQDIAVTGSVDQFGKIQAIGGVNEKIEGFFDVATHQDPDAEHGVIIPHTNVRHLMLRQEVIEAVKKGLFHIYAVRHIDEGIAILTGTDAGEADEHGDYPEASVNGRVATRLREFTKAAERFDKSDRADKSDESAS